MLRRDQIVVVEERDVDTRGRFHTALSGGGTPAILRCQNARDTALFVFDHTLASGRTFHGGVPELPWLRVMAKSMRGVRITLHTQADGDEGRPAKPS